MRKLFRSRLLRFLPGVLLRLSSLWLLASFAILYYGHYSASGVISSVRTGNSLQEFLAWPLAFFVLSLIFSILLYFIDTATKNDPPEHIADW